MRLPPSLAFGSRYSFTTPLVALPTLSYYSLKNHGATEEVDGMFEMGAETMKLPLEEKMKYEQGDDGVSFGLGIVSGSQVYKPDNPFNQVQSCWCQRGRCNRKLGHRRVYQYRKGRRASLAKTSSTCLPLHRQ